MLQRNRPTTGNDFNRQFWAKRDPDNDTGQNNMFIGTAVRKPDGTPSKLFSSGNNNDPTRRFDVFQIKLADGKTWSSPLVEGNRYYDEVMKQVKAGTLTIKDAD